MSLDTASKRICPSCGAENPALANYCARCGKEVDRPQVASTVVPQVQPTIDTRQKQLEIEKREIELELLKRRQKISRFFGGVFSTIFWLLILGVSGFVLLIVVALFANAGRR